MKLVRLVLIGAMLLIAATVFAAEKRTLEWHLDEARKGHEQIIVACNAKPTPALIEECRRTANATYAQALRDIRAHFERQK